MSAVLVDKAILTKAQALVAEYQEFAAVEASFLAEDSLRCGDAQGASHWRQVAIAVELLEPRTARVGESIH